jgi:hypothetical protein
MNKHEEFKDDLLRQYITSERIEKAPEGFTSKVMTRIQVDTSSLLVEEKSRKKNLVPFISSVVTVLLIASAVLIQGSQSDSLANPVFSLIKNIKFSVPEINLSSIFRLSLPSVLMYVFIGMIILSLFDRALYVIFHREK